MNKRHFLKTASLIAAASLLPSAVLSKTSKFYRAEEYALFNCVDKDAAGWYVPGVLYKIPADIYDQYFGPNAITIPSIELLQGRLRIVEDVKEELVNLRDNDIEACVNVGNVPTDNDLKYCGMSHIVIKPKEWPAYAYFRSPTIPYRRPVL